MASNEIQLNILPVELTKALEICYVECIAGIWDFSLSLCCKIFSRVFYFSFHMQFRQIISDHTCIESQILQLHNGITKH